MTSPDSRPVPWPTDEEFRAVIAACSRPSDRLILLALRLHDPYPDSGGATPGYRRLAELTGLKAQTIWNRLTALAKAGHIERRRVGRLAVYYIMPPHLLTGEYTSGSDSYSPASRPEATTPTQHLPKLVTQEKELDTKPCARRNRRAGNPASQPTTSGGAGRPTWLTPFVDVWIETYGGKPPYGQLAKALKPLVDEYGHEQVLAHWRAYCSRTEARFASPARFAQTFGTWAPRPRREYMTPEEFRAFEAEADRA